MESPKFVTPSRLKDQQSDKSLSVVALIPAFNESRNISHIIEKVKQYVTSVIVIDDGSNDNTASLAESMEARVLKNRRNLGKGAALKRGLIESSKINADVVITIDADGQHDPSDIPKLLEPIESGEADIVIGSRYGNGAPSEVPYYRKVGLSFIKRLNQLLTASGVLDTQSGFRAYSANALDVILDYRSNGYGAETEQIARAELSGLRIVEVPVHIKYIGLAKTSKENALKHGANIVSTIIDIAVDRRPLLVFGVPGMLAVLVAIFSASELLVLFNETRYFSIPLALISAGSFIIGALLIVTSFIFVALGRRTYNRDRHY